MATRSRLHRRRFAALFLAACAAAIAVPSCSSSTPPTTASNSASSAPSTSASTSASTIDPTTETGPPTQQYSLGNPSAEEQLMWFLINRARADPAAEGRRLATLDEPLVQDGIKAFGVDTTQLQTDFAGYSVRPPVAWNPGLATAALRQANDQALHRTQQHRGSDGSTPAARIRAAGVKATSSVENLSSYAHSPIFADAAFQIDWGGKAPTGVQDWPKPGHRFAIMSADSTLPPTNAVGVAWVAAVAATATTATTAVDDSFGPFVVVQEFARIKQTFIVGTVWADSNGNGILDPGEGVGSVDVRPDHGHWFTITASAGGYEIPVMAGTTYTLSISAAGYRSTQMRIDVQTENAPADIQLQR